MNPVQETIGTRPLGPPHILVMEDEFSVASGLQMVLTEEGYTVDMARTGHSALDMFSQKAFDLLLADLRLPDIDGMEVIKRVKETRPETETIVITGYPSVSSAVTAVKMGVFDYLRKPFTDDELKEAVEGALKKRQQASIEEIITDAEKERVIQKQEVIRVLDRTSQDAGFWRDLMEKGSQALEGYRLSSEAKAAIALGDVRWVRENVGDLDPEQLLFMYKILEREAW